VGPRGTGANATPRRVRSVRYATRAPHEQRPGPVCGQCAWLTSEVFTEANRYTQEPEEQAGPAEVADPIAEVEERLDDAQTLALSRAHFRCLTSKERLVMAEYVEKGRPAWEVAQEMNVTPTWVRRLAARASIQLARCLKDPGHA
jgi:DNA-directed RNA polymerase specialized sigma24 family protein